MKRKSVDRLTWGILGVFVTIGIAALFLGAVIIFLGIKKIIP